MKIHRQFYTIYRTALVVAIMAAGSSIALAQSVTVTLDMSKKHQSMKGFGTNITGIAWGNGALAPALDQLVAMGMTNARVVLDNNWETTDSNPDPTVIDWTYYNALYSNSDFTSLWNTIAYLNQKGLKGEAITLSAMGRVPPWMGLTQINTAFEDHWVRMVASMVYYARVTKGLNFMLLDPMNEPDWNGIEGPQVGSTQYVRLLNKLAKRLDALGLTDIRFLGPNTASVGSGVNDYIPALLGDPVVMAKLPHFGLHDYGGSTGGVDSVIKSSAYPDRDFWMTEYSSGADATNIVQFLQGDVTQGAAACLVWHGIDTLIPYRHNPDDNQGWGCLQEGPAGVFTPRQSYFNAKPIYTAVKPGMVRFDASETNASLITHAYTDLASGNVAITGSNSGAALTYVGTFVNGATLNGVLQLYETTSSENYVRRADVLVSNGVLSAPISSGSVFALTGALNSSGVLSIATTVVPDGSAGAPYSQTLLATGGTRPYAWSVSSGALPSGLTLSSAGVISGTPTAAGSATFTAKVSDSASGSATKSFTLNISRQNLALTGTAYRWFAMTSATANTGKTAAPGLNDNNLTSDVSLSGGGDDAANAYEAGGMIFPSAQTIDKVVFISGSFNASSFDGVFDKNFGIQTSTDGTTWTAVSNWSLTPAYAYNSPSAGNVSYTFSGAALNVLGVRVVGQVHSLPGNDSWFANATEVQAFSSGGATNNPPTVATPSSATPNPVTGKTTVLSVLGADDGGEAALTYTWFAPTAPAPVTLTATGTNAAKNTTATFSVAGAYVFSAVITDASGQSVSSNVSVTVQQTATKVTVSPASATIAPGATQQFTASVTDQFAKPLTTQPAITWTVSGGGTISATGLFTAGSASGGPFTVTASAVGLSGTASITVSSSTNIASSGVAYRWSAMASSTANATRTAAPGLNDGNLTANVDLSGAHDDVLNAYEAAGVVWSSTQSISKVIFKNGTYDPSQDGVFDATFKLQSSADGTTWTDVSGWSLAPAYAYNSPSASGVIYTFTGPSLSARGVRCTGQVHTSNTGVNSWYVNATEVQVFGGSAATPPTITTQPANQTVNAGQSATFSVTASGTAPLAYQWQKNGATISGATAATYTTPATTSADNGATFQVLVSNSAGSVTSFAATLTVNAVIPPPAILSLTANPTTIYATQSSLLRWTVQNATTLTLAPEGGDVTGLSAVSVSPSSTTTYTLTATNTSGSVSQSVLVTFVAGPPPPPPGQTLLTTQQPATVDNIDGPGVNYELGMRFTSATDGQITAIRFWKSPSETGLHTGHIWAADGTVLSTINFTGETAQGWQEQPLASPLTISANTEYLVSVNTGAGFYVDDVNGFASQIVNGDLKSIVGGNGRYGAPGQYPAQTWLSSNYFRDVKFVTSNPPPAITSAATASPNPAVVAQGVTFTAAAADADGDTLTYSWNFGDGATASGSSVSHTYASAGSFSATVTIDDGHQTVTSSTVVVVNATAPTK
jgi:O-glycosyl hydrolase